MVGDPQVAVRTLRIVIASRGATVNVAEAGSECAG
jgi:hypothetical protein